MQLRIIGITSLITTFHCIPTVLGWGAAGHEIVATIAQIHLDTHILPRICTILGLTSENPDEPLCHLAPIAAWADRIRFKMRWSAALHYIGARDDHPPEICGYPGERGWAGRKGNNVLGGIWNTTNILKEWVEKERSSGHVTDEDTDRANEALKFLIHFLGDMHQPLHLTGRDRGGNSDKVLFDGRLTNLHSLWDTLLIAKAIRNVPRKYSRPLPSGQIESNLRGTIYDGYVRRIMWEGVFDKWQGELSNWVSCPSPIINDNTSSGPGLVQHVIEFWSLLAGRQTNGADDYDDEVLCPYHWSQQIHQLNCDFIWPKELDEPPFSETRLADITPEDDKGLSPEAEANLIDQYGYFAGGRAPHGGPYLELDTPEYAGFIAEEWVVEKLLAQAGIRLAAILNSIFARDGSRINTVSDF